MMTGLTDAMSRLSRDEGLRRHHEVTPAARQDAVHKLWLTKKDNGRRTSRNWGLTLEATMLPRGSCSRARNHPLWARLQGARDPEGGLGRAATTREVTTPVALRKSGPSSSGKELRRGGTSVLQSPAATGSRMGIQIANPKPIASAERPNRHVHERIARHLGSHRADGHVRIPPPQQKADRYAAVKKLCCIEPVAESGDDPENDPE